MVLGWLSPVLPLLQSAESPLESGPLTVEQTSWVGCLICVGGLFGNYIYIFLSNKIGRKTAINLLAFPQTAFWITVLLGNAHYHLYMARIFAGITGGGVFAIIPLFIADIAEPNVRGRLGSMLLLVLNVGILLSYTVGAFVNYSIFPLTMIGVPIIFAIVVYFLPETPQSLVKLNKMDAANISYRFYRGVDIDVNLTKIQSEELREILANTGEVAKQAEFSLKDLGKLHKFNFNIRHLYYSPFIIVSRAAISGILIGIMLMILNQFSGGFVIINYAGTIFRDAGSNLSPNMSSIIVAALQIAGCYTAAILIDKSGRKILLLISTSGITLGLGVLGCYLYLAHHKYNVTQFAIIPVVSLSFVIFIACLGILTVPFVILAEILPTNIRSIGSLITLSVLTSTAFMLLKFFPILALHIHLYGCMWMFSGVCALGTIMIIVFVPETKGKNLISGITDKKVAAGPTTAKI